MKRSKTSAEKKISYELIAVEGEIGQPMYALLGEIVRAHHDDLQRYGARIVLAWCTSWKADVDGRVTIGKCKKASDLDRELAPYDFVILFSRDFWDRATTVQRTALIDHELSHAAVKYDSRGEPVLDARHRTVFRTRKHDLEEFADVVARHGTYKHDLEQFAKAIDRARSATGYYFVSYQTIQARLQHAGFTVSLERILAWTDAERRDALEWLNLRKELLGASVGGVTVPPAPAFVTVAVEQPSVLHETGA